MHTLPRFDQHMARLDRNLAELRIGNPMFVMTNVMKPASDAQRSQGVACVTAEDFRWEKAHIKSTSLLGAVFARQISFDAGAAETIMFRDGHPVGSGLPGPVYAQLYAGYQQAKEQTRLGVTH